MSGADEWLTPSEVAAMTRLTVQTLSNHRWQGRGPAFTKLTPGRGGRVRYRRSDVERWLAGEPTAA
ncbi:helix-turn-helix transcriptional regulator [Kitasatospora sp. NPDC056184]|uniref:helix-turn-helix transcriptional regulator n=1 Tax=Kitasatospora sp. NPDC056184 TaxID=3345738 RepID=UPI0035D6AA0F